MHKPGFEQERLWIEQAILESGGLRVHTAVNQIDEVAVTAKYNDSEGRACKIVIGCVPALTEAGIVNAVRKAMRNPIILIG